MRFKQFLMEEDTVKPPKPRPQKTLWFDNYENWAADIKRHHPDAEAHKTPDDLIVALNNEEDKCYGKWDQVDQKGITFNKFRDLDSVLGRNTKLTKISNTNKIMRNSAHQ